MKWFRVEAHYSDGLVHLTNDLAMLVAYVHDRENQPQKVGFACGIGAHAVRSWKHATCLECIARAR